MKPCSTKSSRNVVSSRNRRNPRGVKRKMSCFPLRPRADNHLPPVNIEKAIKMLK